MLPAYRHRSARKCTAGNRICLTLNVSSAIVALTLGLTVVLQTPRYARDCSEQMRADR